ncbi:MAG: helix-turn-helix transcriptional regulator [Erysipelotrichaceae bacterium]|nr:helix-turn-helix transcriptional regulator [Erysipelotrichaceae bacterium]
MNTPLTYIEERMKELMGAYPQYYDHILSGEELADFIFMLMREYSSSLDREKILSDSENLINGEFFRENVGSMVSNGLDERQREEYRKSFTEQTESEYISRNYDISWSRVIRYMPAQWHWSSYFQIYYLQEGPCDILFRNDTALTLKRGDLLIVSPFSECATPSFRDDAVLEYYLVRSSSFDRVFWEQLNHDSIMSHFFRNALKNDVSSRSSYLLFETGEDEEIRHILLQIKEELHRKLPYSSPLCNALMSALFSLTLRRYENSVVLPGGEEGKWKKEYSKIFTCIQDRFTDMTLQEIADTCGYSAKQISRIVASYFSMSYSELVTFLKMDRASSLLKEKTLSMEEISRALGYSDLPSFYRAFKKFYRMTPLQYQKEGI